jgi:hypothetical protein
MTTVHEIRFKVTHDDYCFLKGLAGFYYDYRVIPRPSVHSLAKSATIKAANEWLQQQSNALKQRKQRKQIFDSISDYKT